ncbi:Uncharacterized protein C20orf26 like protein, partial [Dufourea novaeangliae]
NVFEKQMIRVPSKCHGNTDSVQCVYRTIEILKHSRLKIRRVVEEDNDIVVPLIDAESSLLKEYYGEYYVSEIVRYPNDYRQLIVSEDAEGLPSGVMFLNRRIDVDVLNENFELGPYNGLRKPHENDLFPPESMEPPSETFFASFSGKPQEEMDGGVPIIIPSDQTLEGWERPIEEGSFVSLADQKTNQKNRKRSTLFVDDARTASDDYNKYFLSRILLHGFEDIADDFLRNIDAPSPVESKTKPEEQTGLPTRPVYCGEPNAFVVEIFTVQERIKYRSGRNFLEAAFECFPDLEYCAILLPFSHPPLPLLESFVRVPARSNRDYPMILHVTHRAALLGEIETRAGDPCDLEAVQELLGSIPKADSILADFDVATRKEQSDLHSYVFTWNNKVVGVMILCVEKEVTYIRRRFHVEDYIATKDVPQDAYARVLHFVLMPIFSIHLRHLFSETMRLSGLIVFYYRLTGNALSALTRAQPLAICLTAMVHVRPRRRIEYRFRGLTETDEPDTNREPFSLFMTTPRIITSGNLIFDTKIVVIGASDCGVAVLEQLAFGSTHDSTRFANLTVISPNGLPFENERSPMVASMMPFYGRYCREYRRTVTARSWINVVYGTVIAIDRIDDDPLSSLVEYLIGRVIDRKGKYVTVMRQGNVAYDYLIVTCGLQYQMPQFEAELDAQRTGEFVDRGPPWNCLVLNDDTQAAMCLNKIQLLTNNFEDQKSIILYGRNIDCYCALQGLLESGMDGSWITLIEPPMDQCDSHDSIFYNDCEVHAVVMNAISISGVTILAEWELVDWYLRESTEGTIIEALVLRSKNTTTILDAVSIAFCRAGLMFDGQLVIDPEFRTNDPFIFAAGTGTKYSRRFSAEAWQHKYYNSIEIGERLAKVLRSIIDEQNVETAATTTSKPKKQKTAFPSFRSGHVVACTLPGGYRYLHVHTPGKHGTQQKRVLHREFYGTDMVTGSCESDIGYFRLRLSCYDTVKMITCLSKKDFEVHQMIKLYGMHEKLLNELKTRFQKSLISDFYAYFREPWATALFYDRFDCLRVENRALLLSKTAIPGQSLIDDCISALTKSKWEPMQEMDRRSIEARYAGSVYHQELEDNLLDFLQFYEEDMPVYCTPDKLHELYDDVEYSPLYTEL